MADNTTLNLGTGGDVIATDDISGVKFQRVKLIHGADGVNAGDVATGNPLPVGDAGGSLTIDNPVLSQAGSGSEAGVLRVTIATDSSGVLSVDDNGGSLTVDGTVGLSAGSANIGDVDVLTVPAPLSTSGGGTEASALRVTIANDSTGLVSVDDNGGSLTIDNPLLSMSGGGTESGVLRVTVANDSTGLLSVDDNGGSLTVDGSVTGLGNFVTCSTDVTRPADTIAYAANDALSDSTSAPTSGGFTFTSAARASGGSGIITDLIVTTSADPATLLQGELFIFDRAVTNINDNTAFAVTDAEIKTCVAKIPFTLEDVGNNGFYHAQNLNIGFTCSGSANLRFLVRVKNAYTPANAEVVTFVLKCLQVT